MLPATKENQTISSYITRYNAKKLDNNMILIPGVGSNLSRNCWNGNKKIEGFYEIDSDFNHKYLFHLLKDKPSVWKPGISLKTKLVVPAPYFTSNQLPDFFCRHVIVKMQSFSVFQEPDPISHGIPPKRDTIILSSSETEVLPNRFILRINRCNDVFSAAHFR